MRPIGPSPEAEAEQCHIAGRVPSPVAVAAFEHAHAVVVETSAGRVNRRLYFSLHSAEKALGRARDRGDDASILVVKLVPIVGGECW